MNFPNKFWVVGSQSITCSYQNIFLLHMKAYVTLFPGLIGLSLFSGLAGLSLSVAAQRPGEGGMRAEGSPREGARGGEARPAATIASLTQGLKKFEGFFNFYYDEKAGKVLLEIDRFDQEFLYFSSLPQGVGN